MPNFVDDNLTLDLKTALRPTRPGAEEYTVRAEDWNRLVQACYDLRAALQAAQADIAALEADPGGLQVTPAIAISDAAAVGTYALTSLGTRDWLTHNNDTNLYPRATPYTGLQAKYNGPKALLNGFDLVRRAQVNMFGATFVAGATIQAGSDLIGAGGATNSTTFYGQNTSSSSGFGFSLAVPGSPVQQTLNVVWCHDSSIVTMTARLFDGSGLSATTTDTANAGVSRTRQTTITWTSLAPMSVEFLLTTNSQNGCGVYFGGAWLT